MAVRPAWAWPMPLVPDGFSEAVTSLGGAGLGAQQEGGSVLGPPRLACSRWCWLQRPRPEPLSFAGWHVEALRVGPALPSTLRGSCLFLALV